VSIEQIFFFEAQIAESKEQTLVSQGWGFLDFSQRAEEQEQTLVREGPKSREQRAEATQQGVK